MVAFNFIAVFLFCTGRVFASFEGDQSKVPSVPSTQHGSLLTQVLAGSVYIGSPLHDQSLSFGKNWGDYGGFLPVVTSDATLIDTVVQPENPENKVEKKRKRNELVKVSSSSTSGRQPKKKMTVALLAARLGGVEDQLQGAYKRIKSLEAEVDELKFTLGSGSRR